MAKETVTQSSRFYCVSVTPDFCKTPVGASTPPVPYQIKGEFKQAKDVSPNVKAHSEPLIIHDKSYIPTVTGDEPGSATGVKSGTVGKKVETKEHSPSFGSNQTKTVEVGHIVWMNNRNTTGQISERGGKTMVDMLKAEVKAVAEGYLNNVSDPLKKFGDDAMETSATIGTASLATAGAGLVAGATVVGAPAAVALEATAAAGGTVSLGVGAVGLATKSVASGLDQVANWIVHNKTPDVVSAGMELAGGVIASRLRVPGFLKPWLKKGGDLLEEGVNKVKTQAKPIIDKAERYIGEKGGKILQLIEEKLGKPADCCPKNNDAKGPKPVHFGTGEEILYQTDFSLAGSLPLSWQRCYRSGSETEDWSMLGARWACEFTTSLSSCKRGMVYHDATGRPVILPLLAIGASHDSVEENFILTRDSDSQFTLLWRNGQREVFERGENGWLPHGYRGVNAMRAPQAPAAVRRYHLRRSQAADGRGYTVERRPQAKAGYALLRIVLDNGIVLEALRAPDPQEGGMPLIGQIDQVFADRSRVCHVQYTYAPEPEQAIVPKHGQAQPDASFLTLPPRFNLIEQSNALAQTRTYQYQHHLLQRYTTYTGFAHELAWISLDGLRAAWQGYAADLADASVEEQEKALIARYPINLNNSYQARAISTCGADGRNACKITYLDNDTTRVTHADGNVLEYKFNAQWLITGIKRQAPGETLPQSLGRRRWSSTGQLLEDTDAAQRTTRYSYDAAGNLATQTNPAGHTTRYEYDAQNQVICTINALGHATHIEYDANGHVIGQTDALQRQTRYQYNAAGELCMVQDAKGGQSQLQYSAQGQLTSYIDCSQRHSEYRYDTHGNLIAQSDALGQTTHYQYDACNRLRAITHPDGSQEQFTHDGEGNLLSHRDAKGQTTHYQYNGHDLPIERIDAKGQRMQYRYDAALRLVELINGNGESYYFAYHPQGWLASETGFDGKVTQYAYDEVGQLISQTCGGQTTALARDVNGQLVGKVNDAGIVRYAYDALGRMIALASPHAQQRLMFDPVGQLIEERFHLDLPAPTPQQASIPAPSAEIEATGNSIGYVLQHRYDELGNRIHTSLPNGRTIDTLRYGSGHWHGSLWQGQSLIDIERDALHRETLRQMGGNLQAQSSYDAQSRLSEFHFSRKKQASRQSRQYQYDSNGDLTDIFDNQRGNLHYRYDPLGQLLSALQPGLSETFAFDPAGNLLDQNAPSNAPANTAASGQFAPALPMLTGNLLRRYCGNTYQYDEQGNMNVRIGPDSALDANQAASKLMLDYNADNALISAKRNAPNRHEHAEYFYDAFQRRIAKRVTEEVLDLATRQVKQRSRRTTFFLWDGDKLAQEIEAGNTVTYLYEPDSFVPMARIASQEEEEIYARGTVYLPHMASWDMLDVRMDAAAHVLAHDAHEGERIHAHLRHCRMQEARQNAHKDQIYYYQVDHLGTPLELVDTEGGTVWSAKYMAWGKVWQLDADDVAQPLRFQGQYFDQESGLHYNRFRYYDPQVGRFIGQDPVGLFGGENLYQYAPNPTGWVDVAGLSKIKNSNLKGAYSDVGGHHIHAKSGLRGHPTYDPCKGFSIGQDYMKSRGWDHDEMTRTQRTLFDKLAKSGKPNDLVTHSKIAKDALIAGGASAKEAAALVKASVADLKQQGVTCPTRIPWN